MTSLYVDDDGSSKCATWPFLRVSPRFARTCSATVRTTP